MWMSEVALLIVMVGGGIAGLAIREAMPSGAMVAVGWFYALGR